MPAGEVCAAHLFQNCTPIIQRMEHLRKSSRDRVSRISNNVASFSLPIVNQSGCCGKSAFQNIVFEVRAGMDHILYITERRGYKETYRYHIFKKNC